MTTYDAGGPVWMPIRLKNGTFYDRTAARNTYDPVRSLQVSNLTLPNGAHITNSYDSVARLLSTALETSAGSVINAHQYAYNPGNQRTEQTFTAGNYVNYTYDNIGQLRTALGTEPGGVTNRMLEQFGYAYDAAGNLNFRTNNALVETFNVNSLNELTTETNAGTLTVAGTTTSHATSTTVNGLPATNYVDSTFARGGFTPTNGTNSFTAIAQDGLGREDTNTVSVNLPATNIFTYDLNGNLVSDGNRNFAYDDENRLTSVWVTNVWRSDFIYDGKMRRRIRVEYTWSGSSWLTNTVVRYIYDGNVVIQERWLSPQLLPQDAITYTRGRDLSGSLQGAGGVGGLLARTDTAQLLSPGFAFSPQAYYHCNGNGNITCMVNSNQAIVAKYLYDPFGNILRQDGSLAGANLYRFSSKELNASSGLVSYLYRFYDPNLQRWLSSDPVLEPGFATVARPSSEGPLLPPGQYVFVKNCPTALIDAEGLSEWHICCRASHGIDAGIFTHCDLRNWPCDSPQDRDYPVQKTDSKCCKMDNGTDISTATQADINGCLGRNPYDAGLGIPGSNCQSNTRQRLCLCCLTSNWTPDWYAYGVRTGDPWSQYPKCY